MPERRAHPVWSLYDEMRTARLNVKCIECELRKYRSRHNWIESILAISSTSSIGGFWFLQNFVGGYIWKSVGAIAVICTALKPILKISEKIRPLQELLVSYKTLEHDFHCLCIEVNQRNQYSDDLHREFKKILGRKAELLKKESFSSLSEKETDACYAQVLRELPENSFHIPE